MKKLIKMLHTRCNIEFWHFHRATASANNETNEANTSVCASSIVNKGRADNHANFSVSSSRDKGRGQGNRHLLSPDCVTTLRQGLPVIVDSQPLQVDAFFHGTLRPFRSMSLFLDLSPPFPFPRTFRISSDNDLGCISPPCGQQS